MENLKTALLRQLEYAEPGLDMHGADRRMFLFAYQDFVTYSKANSQTTPGTATDVSIEEHLDRLFEKDPTEAQEFIVVWAAMWIRKWKARVKLNLTSKTQPTQKTAAPAQAPEKTEFAWRSLPPARKQEMTDMVSQTLVRNGEVCCTQVLAETLLKRELGKIKTAELNDREQVFAAVNAALRRAREVARTNGPLITVQVDKSYYASAKNCSPSITTQ